MWFELAIKFESRNEAQAVLVLTMNANNEKCDGWRRGVGSRDYNSWIGDKDGISQIYAPPLQFLLAAYALKLKVF